MHENEPNEPTGRTIVIHITRDTLLLVIALLLLIIAVFLIILVPAAQIAGSSLAEEAAASEHSPNSAAVGALPTVTLAPPLLATAAHQPGTHAEVVALEVAAYPSPGGMLEAMRQVQPIQTQLPYFNPNRPTAANDLVISNQSSQSQAPGYPAPFVILPTVVLPPTVILPPTVDVLPTATAEQMIARVTASRSNTKAQAKDAGNPPTTARSSAAPKKPLPVPDILVLHGEHHWSQSLVLTRTYQIAWDAILTIDPGADIQIPAGISLFVDGTLVANGQEGSRVRMRGDPNRHWEGIFGNPNSTIILRHTDIHHGGAGGTLMTSDDSNLILDSVNITENGGQIRINNSHVEIRGSTVANNDMPYGSAIEATYARGSAPHVDLLLNNSRITNNRLANGAAALQVTNEQAEATVILDLQHNTLSGQNGPDLMLFAHGQLGGNITCNAFVGAASGLNVRSNRDQTFTLMLNTRDNAIEGHAPPLDPFYRQNRIGRGAASEIPFFMLNNWWGNTSGPYSPERHADGRGDAVGNTVLFEPWLKERPSCAPYP
jgi:hypothetical protein